MTVHTWSTWPDVKLARAREIGDSLIADIQAWGSLDPARFAIDQSPDRRSFEIRLQVDRALPAERWSLLFGEYLHNARSALDALAWELCCLDGVPTEGVEQIQFPMYDLESAFDDRDRGAVRRVRHMRPEHLGRIRELQPFHASDPNTHALHWLRVLSNHEKHRALVAVDVDLDGEIGVNLAFEPPFDPATHHTLEELTRPPYAYQDGLRVQIHRFATPWISKVGEIRTQIKLQPVVALEELGRAGVGTVMATVAGQIEVTLAWVRHGVVPLHLTGHVPPTPTPV